MRIKHISVAILGLAFALPVLAKQVVYQTFNSWVVACDNTGRCEATGASEDGDGMLTLMREPGAQGALSLTLNTPKKVRAQQLRADKKPVQTEAALWKTTGVDEDYAFTATDLNAIVAFLGQIRQGSLLHFGQEEGDFVSLKGLNATLLLLDETQGRLNTPTALLRRGDQPVTGIPEADPVPQIRAAALPQRKLDDAAKAALIKQVRQSQKALLHSDECSPSDFQKFDTADMLDDQHALVMIECLRGAYQSSSLVFKVPLAQPKQAQRVILDVPLRNKAVGPDRDMVTMGDFEEGMLSHSAKGRGPADCGESATWVWDGKTFRLVSLFFMDSCRGGGPGGWPQLWRADVVR